MDSTGHGINGQTNVRLLVMAPDQQIDDQMVECTLDWTVARLKEHLAQVYPSKPKPENQKIIFLGQLLNDWMVLKDVLQQDYNKEDNLFIVHLVCAGQSKSSLIQKTTSEGVTENGQSATFISATSGATQPTPVQQYYSQLTNQQMAWMQQAYTHYLTRYMQIMAAQGMQVGSNSFYTQPLNINTRVSETTNNNNTTATLNNNNNIEENEAIDNEVTQDLGVARPGGVPADQHQQVAGDINIANNNHNAAQANEAAGAAALNRDWLDIFDMISRIVVLSSIVYFYSSPSRFLIVTFLGFAIYLIQGGFFRGQPAFLGENNNAPVVDNNNQAREHEAIPPGDQIPAPAPAAPRIPSGFPEEEHVQATRTNLNEGNERPGAWAFTWTFFSSFFASLIPDQPNVI